VDRLGITPGQKNYFVPKNTDLSGLNCNISGDNNMYKVTL
jgi:formylmethanofuran dehydrogenase subunit E-like metal-binding protein